MNRPPDNECTFLTCSALKKIEKKIGHDNAKRIYMYIYTQ